MAKQDFCFTYYDGDATRDTSHMNRLERGAYHDLIISQRKFGRLTIDQIKKILGKDFSDCWPSVELVMICKDGKYFIEWLESSIEKMRRQAKHQSDNGKLGGRPKKESQPKPDRKPTESQKKPLGNEDGNGIEDREGFVIPEMVAEFKKLNPNYPIDQNLDFAATQEIAEKIIKWDKLTGIIDFDKIKIRWGEIITHVRQDGHFSKYSLSQINKHFQSIAQSLNGKTHQRTIPGSNGKLGTSDARIAALKEWGTVGSSE